MLSLCQYTRERDCNKSVTSWAAKSFLVARGISPLFYDVPNVANATLGLEGCGDRARSAPELRGRPASPVAGDLAVGLSLVHTLEVEHEARDKDGRQSDNSETLVGLPECRGMGTNWLVKIVTTLEFVPGSLISWGVCEYRCEGKAVVGARLPKVA